MQFRFIAEGILIEYLGQETDCEGKNNFRITSKCGLFTCISIDYGTASASYVRVSSL